MTMLELLNLLKEEAQIYRTHCINSINRNKHMNNLKGECSISQDDVDAVLVDFINNIAVKRGIDYGLYTEDIWET
jgi:hypothetical protein